MVSMTIKGNSIIIRTDTRDAMRGYIQSYKRRGYVSSPIVKKYFRKREYFEVNFDKE